MRRGATVQNSAIMLCRSILLDQSHTPCLLRLKPRTAASFSSSSHGILFLSLAVSTTDRQVSDWLPSSMQTRGQYSVASNSPQLHVARYVWVFLSVASSPREAFGLLMRLNGDDLHLVCQNYVTVKSFRIDGLTFVL